MPLYLESRIVSRKTPRDGKLEISAGSASVLMPFGERLEAQWSGRSAPATVVTMSCTCKGGPGEHEHFFIQSEVLMAMEPESSVALSMDEALGRLTVTPAP